MTGLLFKNACFFSFSHLLKNQIISWWGLESYLGLGFFFHFEMMPWDQICLSFFFFLLKKNYLLPHQISDNEIVWSIQNNPVLLIWHLNQVFGSGSELEEIISLSRSSAIFRPETATIFSMYALPGRWETKDQTAKWVLGSSNWFLYKWQKAPDVRPAKKMWRYPELP